MYNNDLDTNVRIFFILNNGNFLGFLLTLVGSSLCFYTSYIKNILDFLKIIRLNTQLINSSNFKPITTKFKTKTQSTLKLLQFALKTRKIRIKRQN